MLAVTSVTFFFVADVKCGLCENKQKQQSKCYTWTESGPKMFRDQTETTLDRRDPGPGSGPVLILAIRHQTSRYQLINISSTSLLHMFTA